MKNLFFGAILLLACSAAVGQTFTLPALPYAYTALEPSIDAQTMEIHHSRHHQAYVKNLNTALGAEAVSMEDLLLNISKRTDGIRNNAGGHYNHTLFWEILAPASDKKPSAELQRAIESEFKSLDSLKKLLNQAAATRFGSGWAWLIVTPDKKLKVCSSPNQDNPLMDISKDRGIPILGIDVWEHAYYLKYQNKRGDYLNAIWTVVNWESVSAKYQAALGSPLLKRIARESWANLNEFSASVFQMRSSLKSENFDGARGIALGLSGKAKTLSFAGIPVVLQKNGVQEKLDALFKQATLISSLAGGKKFKGEADAQLSEIEKGLSDLLKGLE